MSQALSHFKLLPELVPGQIFFCPPRVHIPPHLWTRISSMVKARGRCSICGAAHRLHAHERFVIHNETISLREVVCVCHDCHEVMHIGRAFDMGRGEQAVKHMARINRISRDDCLALIKTALSEHARLPLASRLEWRIWFAEPWNLPRDCPDHVVLTIKKQ